MSIVFVWSSYVGSFVIGDQILSCLEMSAPVMAQLRVSLERLSSLLCDTYCLFSLQSYFLSRLFDLFSLFSEISPLLCSLLSRVLCCERCLSAAVRVCLVV